MWSNPEVFEYPENVENPEEFEYPGNVENPERIGIFRREVRKSQKLQREWELLQSKHKLLCQMRSHNWRKVDTPDAFAYPLNVAIPETPE
jgi:hypothetical protein